MVMGDAAANVCAEEPFSAQILLVVTWNVITKMCVLFLENLIFP